MAADPQFEERGRATATGIILAAAALMSIGLVAVASASAGTEGTFFHTQFWKTAFGRQATFAVLGLVVMLLAARVGAGSLRWRAGSWWQPALWLAVATVVLLAVVLVPGVGTERHGARRWLHFGPPEYGLGFQPSELAKLTLVVFLAAYLAGHTHLLRRFFACVLPVALVIGLCAGLVGVEDYGTAVLLAAVGGLMLLIAGLRIWHLAVLALPAAAAFAYMLTLKPYRVRRLTAFRDIWSDSQGEGYHAVQSLIGIAGGGWLGKGLGSGVQKYGYLPESRTDFIFSIWAEETGLLGCLVVLLLFGLLLYLGTRAATAAATMFERLLATGVTLMITLQAVINIAVVTVSVPTKGIALPLVSAGGSGTVFYSAALGLLAGVALRGRYHGCPGADQLESFLAAAPAEA
jgi:cell division protein FtsW